MSRKLLLMLTCVGLAVLFGVSSVAAWTPVPVKQDPLVRMPGTQPVPENAPDIEAPTRCTNCHGGFNQTIEPAFNWQGSMMAQAARDFLFYACMTTAAQDSIWAVGTPNATDICERCHFPKGWVEGRSDPTNASLMTGADFDGVQCDMCHSMFDPFFETTFNGTREGSDWLGYWDETNASGTPSNAAALATYNDDARLAASIKLFGGGSFFTGNLPPAAYTENASGQFFLDDNRAKRASFADASARHNMFYSRYHKSKYFCASCHDVSNPVLANAGLSGLQTNGNLVTEEYSAHRYFHVERTFSEFMLSDYGLQGGTDGIGPFAPGLYATSRAGNKIAMCQDCHMRDGVGKAASMNDAVVRPSGSIEHPQSGQPIHDLTGGNAWVSTVLASAVTGSPNYNAANAALLGQGAAALTLDLNQGLGIDPVALLAGADRAMQQLQLAASINKLSYDAASGALSFEVQNQTGHKLISGFPEGRRMWVNIQAFANGSKIFEINPYDNVAGTLKGLPGAHYNSQSGLPLPTALGDNEVYRDDLVYETHPKSDLTGENHTFHFALATGRYKDNRIPPKGFRINEAAARISVPVEHGVDAPNLYTAAEYAGGYDAVSLNIPAGADQVKINLYYQTTSREYIEFLRDEINGYTNTSNTPTLTGTGAGGDAPYLVQNDPFFGQLKAWGNTIWQLWTGNMNVTTAAPFLMASAAIGGGCTPPPIPTLLSATPGNSQVTLEWSNEGAASYNVYYDQAGKSVLIAQGLTGTTFTDSGLTNGTQYCYKVTSVGTCESDFSNVLCAIPTNQGQATMKAGVTSLVTGVLSGKGGNKTFNTQSSFTAGSAVTFKATVVDQGGLPLPGATVDVLITGPESLLITSAASDANGIAYATWSTKAPGKRNPGTTPGTYTGTTKGVTATGYSWDGVETNTTFIIQ